MVKNIIIIAGMILMSGLIVVIPANANAQDQSPSQAIKKVEVRVDGLSCPFCAYGLEKKLKTIEGIQNLKIEIAKGLVTFSLTEGNSVDEEEIKKIVKEAGFTPKGVMFPEQ